MKKWIAILVMITVLFSASAVADNILLLLSDDELLQLHQDVLEEMARRGLSAAEDESAASDRVAAFFAAWSNADLDEMLMLCGSGWKASAENPRTELFRILAGRTPLDAVIERDDEIAGESADGLTYRMVTVAALLDRNNGMEPEAYRICFLVCREEDGLWYVDPTSLEGAEKIGEEIPADSAPAGDPSGVTGETVLYYQPDGGQYYHVDQNCRTIHEKYLPLQNWFLYSELDDEPYCDLKPCAVCGAPLRND